jgi:hypothetical protein
LIEVVLGSATMDARASGRRRDTGLVWGVVAVACVATVLFVWIGVPAATDRSVLGRPGSLVVLAVAVVAAVVGAVASYVPRDTSRQLRWGVAFPVAVIGAGVIVVAAGSLVRPQHAVDFVMGVLLLVGAVAMEVVATAVSRRRIMT